MTNLKKPTLLGYDKFINLMIMLVWVAIIGYTVYSWTDVPDTIAQHFNIRGEADSWGSKSFLPIAIIIGLAVSVLLSIAPNYLHLIHMPFKYDSKFNTETYGTTNTMLRFLNLCLSLLVVVIVLTVVKIGLEEWTSLPMGIMIGLFAMLVLAPIFNVIYLNKYRA